jgi:hypothetical protein
MHHIFARTTKVGRAPRAYNDENQVAPKGASILNLVDIDEDVAHEIFNLLRINKILMDLFLKFSRTLILH